MSNDQEVLSSLVIHNYGLFELGIAGEIDR